MQPSPFIPPYDFSSDLGTEHGNRLDTTFQDVKTTTDQIIENLALIQRDDGVLYNGIVTPDSLSVTTKQMLATGTGTPRGEWASTTSYAIKDIVSRGTTVSYMAVDPHVSSSDFDADLALGHWVLLQNALSAAAASTVTLTPTGDIAASTVQGAIAELDTEKAKVSGDDATPFKVGSSNTYNYAARVEQVQKNSLRYAVGAGTGDAMTATVPGSLNSLTDGMEFIIKAPAANTLTTPTLNLTIGTSVTGVKTITRATTGLAVAAGSIAGAKHFLHLVWNDTDGVWALLNPAA